MIKTTEKVEKIFEELYYAAKEERGVRSSFAKIMESNESRLNFFTYLFNMIKRINLENIFVVYLMKT